MGDNIPLEARERSRASTPFTRNLNKDTTNAAMGEARMDEERISGMVKESTVWDVYNNEARKVDNELVKDWMASLNFLLVFVSPLHISTATCIVLSFIGSHFCGRTHRVYH
jgi:Family of unknown function (DUF6535)